MSNVRFCDLSPLKNILDDIEIPEKKITEKDIIDLKESIYTVIHQFVNDNIIDIRSPYFQNDVYKHTIDVLKHIDLFEEIDLIDYVNEVIDIYFNQIIIPRHTEQNFDVYTNKRNIDKILTKIRNIPQPDQRTDEWYLFRWNHITASSAWKSMESEKTHNQLIYSKCTPINLNLKKSVNINSATHHGHKYEPLSTLIYETKNNTIVEEFGCIEDTEIDFIAASPDGINVKRESPLYGRLLEIKNPKSRKITGIPKKEYWIQMQFQMYVTKLHLCDFLETTFNEYESEEAFYKDGTFNKSDDGKMKGAIVCFYNKEEPVYEYCPLEIDTKEGFELWCDEIIDKNNELSWIKNIWWKLDTYSCVTVEYNEHWFNQAIEYFKKTWEIVLRERKEGFQHRKPNKRISKPKKAPDLIKIPSMLDDLDTPSDNSISPHSDSGNDISKIKEETITTNKKSNVKKQTKRTTKYQNITVPVIKINTESLNNAIISNVNSSN